MRQQALTRKNALFAGHDDGAKNWAILASLIETCRLNGIEPQAYLAERSRPPRQPLAEQSPGRAPSLDLGRCA